MQQNGFGSTGPLSSNHKNPGVRRSRWIEQQQLFVSQVAGRCMCSVRFVAQRKVVGLAFPLACRSIDAPGAADPRSRNSNPPI